MRVRALLSAFPIVVMTTLPLAALADELKVLAAGAIAPVVRTVAADFERRSGIHVDVQNATGGVTERRIRSGERFDLTVVPTNLLHTLAADRYIDARSARELAQVGIGVAVKAGTPHPAIATVAQFKAALLAAPSVAVIDPKAGGSSGIYLEKLFEKLGIAAQMHAKEVLVPGGLVAEKLLDGSAALALHQQSEILAVKGAQLVGPLPATIQSYTVYAAAISSQSNSTTAARAFMTMFSAEQAKAAMREHGLTPKDD
ncbi:molybdate ABC transporter substrate-binding protein [Herbaspirillum sp. alder98]|uniref:molybdate ABC transporter substrate-binding protein n=1 Tax=Herbaspirillum sp. alder98 TaxID=2913096 RepID=UPI001CD8EC0B|nr:substrate-binding domain-containing protein [Herbaspirillum sp. alder98]MCA1324787.1 substrate-binding domain-containing protein [Herbaspirillum sp. alder98]